MRYYRKEHYKMKVCTKCKEIKPISLFSADKYKRDGKSSNCKACRSAHEKMCQRPPERKITKKKWTQTPAGKASSRRSIQRYHDADPRRKNAVAAVYRAVRDGKLLKRPCRVCGTDKRVEGHHPDYDKVLDVIWLCAPHHRQLHIELRVK